MAMHRVRVDRRISQGRFRTRFQDLIWLTCSQDDECITLQHELRVWICQVAVQLTRTQGELTDDGFSMAPCTSSPFLPPLEPAC